MSGKKGRARRGSTGARFKCYIGIDYSGAGDAKSRQSGLQVYYAEGDGEPECLSCPRPKGKRWTRESLAEWLIERALEDSAFIAGIDHAFSYPYCHFKRRGFRSWEEFLRDFRSRWRTHERTVQAALDEVEEKTYPDERFRLTERWTSSAKSIFDFHGQGNVAHSSHAGMPMLLKIREEAEHLIHFWPFDDWKIPKNKSVIVEVYPAIFKNRYPAEDRNTHKQDAYAVARWLRDFDTRGTLERYFEPPLTDCEKRQAEYEGWILGLT